MRSHHPPADTQQPPRSPSPGQLPVALQCHKGSGSSRLGKCLHHSATTKPSPRCERCSGRKQSSALTAASLPPADRCGSQKYPPSLLLHLPRRWRRAEPSAFVRIKAGVMPASIAAPCRAHRRRKRDHVSVSVSAHGELHRVGRGATSSAGRGAGTEASARPVLTVELLLAMTVSWPPRFCTQCVCSTERGTGTAKKEQDGAQGKDSSRDEEPAFHQSRPPRSPGFAPPYARNARSPSTADVTGAVTGALPAEHTPAPPRPAHSVTSRKAAIFKSPRSRRWGWRCCGPSINCRSSTAPPYWYVCGAPGVPGPLALLRSGWDPLGPAGPAPSPRRAYPRP